MTKERDHTPLMVDGEALKWGATPERPVTILQVPRIAGHRDAWI